MEIGARDPQLRNILLLNFDDVAPYRLLSLVALGREVLPGFRLVERHCVVHAIPFDEGHMLGRRCPLYGNDTAAYGAQRVTMG